MKGLREECKLTAVFHKFGVFYPTPTQALPLKRLCHNGTNAVIVVLNEVKNLIISTESIIEILRLMPQDDIATQSRTGEGE